MTPTLTLTRPPEGEDVIEVGIMRDGVEYGRTRDGRLVKLIETVIPLTEQEAAEVARQMRGEWQ